MRKYIIR